MLDRSARIFVAGHRGLVGSAICRQLDKAGFTHILTCPHSRLDLTDQAATRKFFASEKPEVVILAAAKVGGINANNLLPAEFIQTNLEIQANVIDQAYKIGIKHLVFLGSSCIYPRECPQPIKEDYLLTGPLEPTNRPYAVAKISGLETCWAYNRQYGTQFFGVMPTNLYGPGDNYDLEQSHVLPALIRKFHEAKIECRKLVEVWGTGNVWREFLYVDDLADACLFLLDLPEDIRYKIMPSGAPPFVNVGSSSEIQIRALVNVVKDVVGYSGEVRWDHSKPDGTPRKFLDSSRLGMLGWSASTTLNKGIGLAYEDYLQRYQNLVEKVTYGR